jgi:pseudolysin
MCKTCFLARYYFLATYPIRKFFMKKSFLKLSLLPISLLALMPAYAASSVDLMKQPLSILNSFLATKDGTSMVESSRALDVNKTLHVRMQENYLGYMVWGADSIAHIPNGSDTEKSFASVVSALNKHHGYMNGVFYQNINMDLANAPKLVFSQTQAQKAFASARDNYQHKIGIQSHVQDQESQVIVYVDADKKAHWAYKVSFFVAPTKASTLPAKPVYIMDAVSFHVYKEWNDIKTKEVDGGGYGGNKKMGKLVYDGMKEHLNKLTVTREDTKKNCKLQNSEVIVMHEKTGMVISYPCTASDPEHNNVYWSGDMDHVNDGYSPSNDALFGGHVIQHMYQDWYKVPALVDKKGKALKLNMVVHSNMDNAYWDGRKMVFGDGIDMFYPLTSLGVAAHEISHGFTEQHSNLVYSEQSGGMNEAFSDMAAQAAEVYAYGLGKNSWQIGPEIIKAPDQALRYMDKPSKDCGANNKPGDDCSIDDASQYQPYIDVHYTSGVYNRFYYTLANSQGWDARKAFDVMVQANQHYWTANSDFKAGACGVLQAANDLKRDLAVVKAAFDVVKVDYSDCKIVA